MFKIYRNTLEIMLMELNQKLTSAETSKMVLKVSNTMCDCNSSPALMPKPDLMSAVYAPSHHLLDLADL